MSLRDEPRLDTLERWMQEVVMHPDGATAGVRASKVKFRSEDHFIVAGQHAISFAERGLL